MVLTYGQVLAYGEGVARLLLHPSSEIASASELLARCLFFKRIVATPLVCPPSEEVFLLRRKGHTFGVSHPRTCDAAEGCAFVQRYWSRRDLPREAYGRQRRPYAPKGLRVGPNGV